MKKYIVLLLLLAILPGCDSPAASSPEKAEKTVYAMDTVMTLTAYGENGTVGLDRAEAEILRLDDLLSISKESSDIYRLNRDPSATISSETSELLELADTIAQLTDGDFDPTVAPLMDLWGFRTQNYRVPSQAELKEVLRKVGPTRSDEGGVDLGGIAKGYTDRKSVV